MRQGQQNRRGRGRNNRKTHHNPLTRSYESNGPDVKIRGTPSHIAEKYMSLARDAQSSGDPVLAENYLQHAEHYNRIIMTFREQNVQVSGEAMNGAGRHRDSGDGEDFSDDDMDEGDNLVPYSRSQESQPRGERGVNQSRFDERPHRQSQNQGRPVRERYQESRGSYAADRQPEAAEQPEPVQEPQAAEQPASEPVQQPRVATPQRRRDRFATSHEQPEFLRRPVRRPRREANGESAGEANGAAVKDETPDQ